MVRSILWISSIAPSSPFSSVCAALPQPRSRMALAADTRAAAVASLLRMIPTRTLIAVLVWLRAIERISVMVFVISVFMRVWRDVFARRCVGMIDSGIIVANREAKRDGRKIGLPAVVLRARDEADDVGAHENPSHTAIAIYGVDSPVPKRHFRTNGLIGSLSESSPSSPAASGLSGSRLPIAQPAADQLSCRETAITGR